MDSLMKSCATDMWNQFNCVNNAINARAQQTKDANSKLLAHLQKVQNRIDHVANTDLRPVNWTDTGNELVSINWNQHRRMNGFRPGEERN